MAALTVEQAAQRLGFGHVMSVYRRIWAGQLDATDTSLPGSGRPQYRITEDAIERYLESRGIRRPVRGIA